MEEKQVKQPRQVKPKDINKLKKPELPVIFESAEISTEKINDFAGKAEDGLTLDKSVRQRKILAKGDAIMLLLKGYNTNEAREYLIDKYGYSIATCKDICTHAHRDLEKTYEKYLTKTAEYQYAKLEAIANQCLELGKYNEALKAIDLQNRVNKLYNDTFVTNTQINQQIEIKFE